MDIRELARQTAPYVIDLRREFHRNPEISFRETRTMDRICEELTALGLPFERVPEGGVLATLDTGRPGKRLSIRADIDALPMDEADKTLPYSSQVPGVMHSCGHDGHAAMLLGTAKILCAMKAELSGVIYLCFQQAEEVGGGAEALVARLKEKGGVDCSIGTHLDGGSDAGILNLPDGPMMAGARLFTVTVRGEGGHGSRPDKAIDPIKPACAILLQIASIPAQYHNPFDTCVVSPCQIHAGSASNIIPEEAVISGNLRFFKYGDDKLIMERIRQVADNVARAYGATATVTDKAASSLPVINDPKMAAFGRQVAQEVGFTMAPPHDPTCGSDNYSEFLAAFPGFYCDSGARCTRPGASGNHHNPAFDLDESAFERVVTFFCTYAQKFLGE